MMRHPTPFVFDPQFGYLPEQDRYLSARPTPRYRFNIIGAGLNGQEHLRVTYLEGRGLIYGVFDPNPLSVGMARQLQARFNPAHDLVVYPSLEAACHDPAVDGLIICTPNHTHLDVIRVATRANKAILLEKPIATDVATAREITEIAQNYGNIFQVGLQYRYKAMYAEAIYETLTRGTLGEVKLISMAEHRIPFLDKVDQWNKFAEFSGDTLIEKCCHYFDLLNLLAQSRPKTVYATGGMAVNFRDFQRDGKSADILDHAFVTITYANDVRAQFSLCMFAPQFYEELVICGTTGRLKAWENQPFTAHTPPTSQLEIYCDDQRPSRITTPAYPAWIAQSGHNGATFYEHVQWIDQMEGEPRHAATAEEGLWSIIVASAAQESIKSGQIVTLS